MLPDFTLNQLRAIAGGILLFLAIFYIFSGSTNETIEYILLALAIFLIGVALGVPKNPPSVPPR